MGEVASKAGDHKYELALGGLAIAVTAFAAYQGGQARELREIARSIDPYIALALEAPPPQAQLSEQLLVQQLNQYRERPIYRIAVTGGPCAGKSTAMERIKEHFMGAGFHVLVVPQVPTIVAQGGGMKDFGSYGSQDLMHFQLELIKFKIEFENYVARMAEMAQRPTLVLCDRGLVDCAAYMTTEQYQALLDEAGWTWAYMRDRRYDSVIFMNTAAKGAEEYYTLANNAARTETPAQARALDDRTLAAWVGHPYMTVVPNIRGRPFSYKVDLAIKAVQKTIGLGSLKMEYHKFLVEVGQPPAGLKLVDSENEEIFLRSQSSRYVQDRIRKLGQDQSFTYQRRFVGPYRPGDAFREVRRVSLNSLQYATLAANQADPAYRAVHFRRTHFEWNSYYFSLDRMDFVQGCEGAVLLRFECDVELDPLQLIPTWIKVVRNVRNQRQFNMSKIALRQP